MVQCSWNGRALDLTIVTSWVRLPVVAPLCERLRQVVHMLLLLSPSSIIWHQCKNWQGNGRLWKRFGLFGLLSIILSVSSLLAQNHVTELSVTPR